jgi:hypothetical protein
MLKLLSEFRMKMDPTLMIILEQLQELMTGIRQSVSQPERTRKGDLCQPRQTGGLPTYSKRIYIPAERN